MVDAHTKLIAITVQVLSGGIEIGSRVWQRVKVKQILGYGIDRRQNVARVRKPGVFVDQGLHLAGGGIDGLRKIALTFQRGRHCGSEGLPLNVAEAFVVAKKEGLVVLDRSANRRPKLVLIQRFYILRKEIARVQAVIAQEVIERSVQAIRT